MSVAILAGFVTGEGALHAPSLETHFLDKGIDADTLHEIREKERTGCPLCLTSDPWLPCEHRTRRHEDAYIGEGLVAADQVDFRDMLDEQQLEFAFDNGEIVVRNCSLEWVLKLQEIGCSAIVVVGKGLYDLFFPVEAQGELEAVVS